MALSLRGPHITEGQSKMILATNNRMTENPMHANAGVLGTYVSDMPRYNGNIFRRTPMSSPQADPSLMNPVVDPSMELRAPYMVGGNMLHASIADDATYRSDPALQQGVTQSIDKGTVPEHMLEKPAAAPAKPVVATPALITGNARGSMKPPAALSIPNQRIPMGEALMCIGGAGVAASGQGGLAAIGAATNAYGQIQDANRLAEMEAFAIEEARRKSIADRMAASAKTKKGAPTMPTAAYSEAALEAIKDIERNLDDETWWPTSWTTGLAGSIMSAMPGTPAHDVANAITTIESAIGFDRLQAMRDASPTGGALGAISERELAQLNASLGSLKQSATRDQFEKNLKAVKRHYMAAVEAIRAQQIEYRRIHGIEAPAPMPSNADQSPSQQAAPLVFDDATGKWSDEE